ncbi:MAG: HesA/MoeB/ThiF family protein [Solirubrobacteraceae bacterium]
MSDTSLDGRSIIDLSEEDGRYHRQSLISWWDQERLSAARVLVVGAGALGNELVKNLALIGVGLIAVVDLDAVENSNLARCVFFRPEDEGRPKALVLAERAAEVNRDVSLVPYVGDVRFSIGLGRFAEFDVVLGGLDNREARLFVNQACWKTSTPWVDGAIEGLMGVVRVFVPPETACYECTLNEQDRELMAARRSCALLTREEMIAGRTPTTATTSSVVAGMQVQEAVKLLHGDRLGPLALAGCGFQFVGLTHDSYVVRYSRREDCMSHDTYDLDGAVRFDFGTPLRALLGEARALLGEDALLEVEHELVLGARCGACGAERQIRRPVDSLDTGAGICEACGEACKLSFTHTIDDSSPLLDSSYEELGLPSADVLVARSGLERRFFMLSAPEGADRRALLGAGVK